ncbi:MAG: hypothetical protein AAF664_06630, partial [Planctomycetota bacterium]
LIFPPTFLLTAIVGSIFLSAPESEFRIHVLGWASTLRQWDRVVGVLGCFSWFLFAWSISGIAPAIVGIVVGLALASIYVMTLIRPAMAKLQPIVDSTKRLVRDLRLEGSNEQGLREFVARYSGQRWQDFYEAIFGYRALQIMKTRLRNDPSFEGGIDPTILRDRVYTWLASKASANRKTADHEKLARAEQQGLRAEGLSAMEARSQSYQLAAAVMDASEVRLDTKQDLKLAAQAKRARMKAMLADARSGKYAVKREPLATFRWILGGRIRAAAGLILLVLFAIWAKQSGLFENLQATGALESLASGQFDLRAIEDAVSHVDTIDNSGGGENETQFETVGIAPWSVGIAGSMLLASVFFSGVRMTFFAALATLVMLLGPSLGIPDMPSLGLFGASWTFSLLIGAAMYVPGVLLSVDH